MELKNKSLNSTVTLGDLIGVRYNQTWYWDYQIEHVAANEWISNNLSQMQFDQVSASMLKGNAHINEALNLNASNLILTFSTWVYGNVNNDISDREIIHASASIPWDTIDTLFLIKSQQYNVSGENIEVGNANGYISFVPRAFVNALINETNQLDGSLFGIDVKHRVQNIASDYYQFRINVRLFL